MKQYDGMADETLAMLYVGGDNRAFDELLARNQQKLYNYILFVVRDPELANDVFQETFVKVITTPDGSNFAMAEKVVPRSIPIAGVFSFIK